MSAPSFLETRNLKRQRLGPPDVYPQIVKQREDELTGFNLNNGFKHGILNVVPTDEFSTAHLFSLDSNKINHSFTAVLTQKQVVSTFNDAGKKRPQLTKDNFLLVPVINVKIRNHNAWFKELASHKPLSQLCKTKVPVFNKKEDIFQSLADFEIPMVRATWFIKMTAAYHLTQTDTKIKKRVTNDPNSDWTQAIWKFMKEQLAKLKEGSQMGSSGLPTHINTSVGSVGLGAIYHMNSGVSLISREDLEKQLKYISNLAYHMFTEGLLDRQEFLNLFVEEFESIPIFNEVALSYFMPFVLQYVEETTMNHLLARRLSFIAARHLNWILPSPHAKSSSLQETDRPAPQRANSPASQLQCPTRLLPIACTLSCAIQSTIMSCPGALVYYPPPSDVKSCGSPLDMLPCPPSSLPLPELEKDDIEGTKDDSKARSDLRDKEKEIIQRSRATEMRWSFSTCQESVTGYTISKVLNTLENLDKHNIDKLTLFDLYCTIFDEILSEMDDAQMQQSSEDAVVILLCEWAITTKRLGEHRAAMVAKLLDKRQAHYEQGNLKEQKPTSNQLDSMMDTTEANDSTTYQPPHFQNLLFTFLDSQAPELKNPDNMEELQAFKNLVLLFSELLEHDVFSHDLYVNMLISRGDISPGQLNSLPVYSVATPMTNPSHVTTEHNAPLVADSQGMRSDDVDADHSFNQSESLFSPGSRHERHFLDAVRSIEPSKPSTAASSSTTTALWGYGQSRHVQYIMHFPITFQDDCINYEWNQRLMALYGAGRHKAQVKRAVRKVSKHLIRLIQNKRNIDDKSDILQESAWEASVKGSKPIKSSVDDLLCRYRNLSFFDRHMVTSHAAKALLSLISSIIAGRPSNLPRLEAIGLLFNLMVEALNISGLVRTTVSICASLGPLSIALSLDPPSVGGTANQNHSLYITELTLMAVSILRHRQSYLMLSPDLTMDAFIGLFNSVKQPCLINPSKCSSTDRSVLVLLHDLYVAPAYPSRNHPEFSNYVSVVKQVLVSGKKPATSNCRYETEFLKRYIENPNVESSFSVAERFSEQLHDATSRYSFVCSVIITLCNGPKNFEKVNDLATLCAEMTARCSELSSEWLGVLKALCCSTCTSNFNDVLIHVEASDPQIRDPLALFTAVLIARSCLNLEDFIKHVAIPSVLSAFKRIPGSSDLSDPETGARLTCHLLLQLFKAPVPSIFSGSKQSFVLPSFSDRHLLAAVQRNTADGAVLAVLKAVLKLGDATPARRSIFGHDTDVSVTSFLAPIPDFGFDGNSSNQSDSQQLHKNEEEWMERASLRDFARHAVRVICSQAWVQDRCLKSPNMDLIMDQVLTKEQRQSLIQLICYGDGDLKRLSLLGSDPQRYVVNMLTRMSRWTLRQCLLELQVMLGESKEKILPEYIAKATIEVFQKQQQNLESSPEKKFGNNLELDQSSVWLIAPLISKLSPEVKAHVLQRASNILEKSPGWPCSRTSSSGRSDRQDRNSGSLLLNHQPFLTLIITCLKGQVSERRSLLESLHTQIVMIQSDWQNARAQRDAGKDITLYSSTHNGRNEALQLRLSLVGGMFDTIKSNSQYTSDLVILLTRLIHCGMVDIQINRELFHTVYDMIAVLLHHALGGDFSNRAEGSKRDYLNIVKKIKKEIGEQQSKSLSRLRQLLPIQRPEFYVVCCEPIGLLMDVKGNKIPVAVDGSSGLQAASKQKLNPWDIIEGLKYPAPLCLAWFGARKTERKLMRYAEKRLHLFHHDHGNKKYREDFLQPPQFPPEEDEAPPEPAKTTERKTLKTTSGAVSPIAAGDTKKSSKIVRTKRPPKSKKSSESSSLYHKSYGIPNVGMTGDTVGFSMAQHNPPAYQYGTPKTGGTAYVAAPAYSGGQAVHKNKPSKQALEVMLRNRRRIGSHVLPNNTPGSFFENPRPMQIRQRLQGHIKPNVHSMVGGRDVYVNQQIRPHLPQGGHMMNPSGTSNYIPQYNVQKQPIMHGGYNNAGTMYRDAPGATQRAYQQNNLVQGNPSFPQGQMRTSSYNLAMQQGQASYQQHGQVVGMPQSQPQSQYTLNQHPSGRTVQIARIGGQPMGGGMHTMSTGQNMQQATMLNQRQIMEQHPQMINQTQQQFNQTLQQPSGSAMMDMGRPMMNQQQYG